MKLWLSDGWHRQKLYRKTAIPQRIRKSPQWSWQSDRERKFVCWRRNINCFRCHASRSFFYVVGIPDNPSASSLRQWTLLQTAKKRIWGTVRNGFRVVWAMMREMGYSPRQVNESGVFWYSITAYKSIVVCFVLVAKNEYVCSVLHTVVNCPDWPPWFRLYSGKMNLFW